MKKLLAIILLLVSNLASARDSVFQPMLPSMVCLNESYCVDTTRTLRALARLTKTSATTLARKRSAIQDPYFDFCFKFSNAYVTIKFSNQRRDRWSPTLIEAQLAPPKTCTDFFIADKNVYVRPIQLGSSLATVTQKIGPPTKIIHFNNTEEYYYEYGEDDPLSIAVVSYKVKDNIVIYVEGSISP
ncbi:MAG: hypothetical protein Q7U16_14835 [Agitococcus sp.]|nr:hypothetical protein [Agitococcus sp.]